MPLVKVDLERRIGDVKQLRPRLQALAARHPTPLYVYDPDEAARNLERFRCAFADAGIGVLPYYAIKSNPYPGLLRTVADAGHGLDASSPRELRLALRAGARKIVLTGPAKDEEAFELALRHRKRVIVHLESRRELLALARLAAARGVEARCCLRLATRHQRRWNKFGIPLEQLGQCLRAARRHPLLRLVGFHFHSGTLSRPDPVVKTLGELGRALRETLTPAQRSRLELVDVGGGVVPEAFEGIYPWNRAQSMRFDRSARVLGRILADEIQPHYEAAEVTPVEEYGAKVAGAFRRHIAPLCPSAALAAEPGKFISHSVMHMLLRVAEIKGPQTVIVDGGTNMIGWEKYEYFDYAPIFNLTRFAPRRERPTLVYGSLCTPHDLWGYYLRGPAPQVGDLLCLPFQGAYTFTLAQSFIRPIPEVVTL